jgi:glyoxylate/hydroxypyruvate reductase
MTAHERILLATTGWNPGAWLQVFRRECPDRQTVTEPDGPADPSIRYAVVWKHAPGSLARLPNLRAIFSLGAGVDHVYLDPALPDVPVIRIVSADLTMRMTEYVVWQVLDHARQGPAYRAQQQQRKWRELPQPAAASLTVGIMGLGVLGTDAAGKLGNIGFRIAGWSRNEKRIAGIACHHGAAGLDAFLGESDIVVVLLPLTVETRGIIDASLVARMKRPTPLGGPVLINAGRGGLQVESDILTALDDGTLMAASLDVFENEPLAAESRLWTHPRVTLTPHIAATSDPARLVPELLREMENLERGRPVKGLVNGRAGY